MDTGRDFTGKVALVTGAGGGIGRVTAILLSRRGAAVVLTDRAAHGLDATAATITGSGAEAHCVVGDLADPSGVRSVAAAARDWKGGVDVVVSVAGVMGRALTADLTVEDWDLFMAVNLRAPFLLAQALAPDLVARRGNMVAVASIAGLQGWAYSPHYAASKAGLIMAMKSLALEFGPRGVRFNTVCPGGVQTDMGGRPPMPGSDPTVLKRSTGLEGTMARPDDVAAAICYLASTDAAFVNGTTLTVDGGAFA